MSNAAYISLLKDKQVEDYDEYIEWKEYQERIEADAANQSLWSSITGIVSGVATFLITKNPYYAYAAYTAGSRVGHEVTEWTGYEPGYDAPDISAGKWNVKEGKEALEDEQDRLDDEEYANLIGIGTDLFSVVTSLYSGGKYAAEKAASIAASDTAELANTSTYAEQTLGWEVNPLYEGDEIVGYQVLDDAGLEVAADELAGMGLTESAQPIAGMWDPITLSSGNIFDPIYGEITTPGLFSAEGAILRKNLFEEIMPYQSEQSIYDFLDMFKKEGQ